MAPNTNRAERFKAQFGINVPTPVSRQNLGEQHDDPVPPSTEPIGLSQQGLAASIEDARQKSKIAAKEKRKEDRASRQQEMVRSFKRAQRYLGLRARTTSDDGDSRCPSPSLSPIDVHNKVPFPCDCDVVFIAVDVESFERNHNIITEIGVATLDTRDIHDVAPGARGEEWRKYIRARHFRIREYKDLQNKDFVAGCPNRFDFGDSGFIAKRDTPGMVAGCFRPPYSKPLSSPTSQDSDENAGTEAKRNIVFLGHDTKTDVAYLQKAGYDVTNLSNLLEFQDTSMMYRVFTQEPNPRSLAHVLLLCDVEPWNLHNAGNDAVYTMQAMLGLCVKDAVENRDEDKLEKEREEALEVRVEAARKEAEEKTREEAEGWEQDDDDDGGVPVKQMGGMRLGK